jgi:hypothetical protein
MALRSFENFKFLCDHITKDLSWSKHTNIVVKRVRQCLLALRRLKIFVIGPQILKRFYSIIAWYGSCSASDCKALQRVVRASCNPGPLFPGGVTGRP